MRYLNRILGLAGAGLVLVALLSAVVLFLTIAVSAFEIALLTPPYILVVEAMSILATLSLGIYVKGLMD